MTHPAFKIGDTTIPIATQFRLGDFVLIEELTGLDQDKFASRYDTLEKTDKPDALVMVGVVGVSVWQANPDWSRADVVKYVEGVDAATFSTVRGDAGPPAEPPAEAESLSPGTSNASTTTPAD